MAGRGVPWSAEGDPGEVVATGGGFHLLGTGEVVDHHLTVVLEVLVQPR